VIGSQEGPVVADANLLKDLLAEMGKVITVFLRSIHYLGPIRPDPERVYRFNQADEQIWRKKGWGAWVDFLALRLGDTQTIDEIGGWLAHLELGPQIRPTPRGLEGLGFISQVSVFESIDGIPFNLKRFRACLQSLF
jgi:hypothetical protein